MGAALVVLVLVCGYLFINSHIPSKILFKKSTGWQSYFQVALKGSIYLTLAALSLVMFWIAAFVVMQIFNLPHFFNSSLHKFSFAMDLIDGSIAGIGLPFVALASLTIFISVMESKQAEKQLKDPDARRKIFEEVAKCSPIENVLLESLDSNHRLLVSISLKSRKVYVGMVHEARLEEHDTDTVVIIPLLSGYRDKDTLSFREEVNYADHYEECGITFTSEPLSLSQYRHVIPRDQIESISLFNSDMYTKFKEKK
ncbi:hypothetical protein M988_2009 [Hafnia paralvei ATCC 29927]|uniref:hypothetical protein n=1 Tax=Hafnia paralvei TaxID=546367 RepID=UPI0007E33FCA|nr:hypothetical protein [Hafnia paralvei]OAT41384.1 hypothetical protein M988_2009 [Hafnia paralvei ATCC 29927]